MEVSLVVAVIFEDQSCIGNRVFCVVLDRLLEEVLVKLEVVKDISLEKIL